MLKMERAFHNSQWKGLYVLSYDDALLYSDDRDDEKKVVKKKKSRKML